MITSLNEDDYIKDACEQLNHFETEVCVSVERDFLHRLEGGCTAPIGAFAYVDDKTEEINFKGVLLSKDGKKKIEVAKTVPLDKHRFLAKDCADYIINRGGKQLIINDIDVEEESGINVFSTKSLSLSQTKLFHNNISSDSSDFIKIRSNRIPSKIVKEPIENVVITSKNGVEALLDNFSKDELNFGNIFCVGRRTKKLIEQKIGPVSHVEKNVKKLAEYLSSKLKKRQVTYFCSDLRLDTLPDVLSKNEIHVTEVVAYKTMHSPELISNDIVGVMFYSPSTVDSYLKENSTDKVAFCIGESTAKQARKYFERVEVAQLPTVESVIEMVNLHYV
jgi:uroporphyrinogen-III synthase